MTLFKMIFTALRKRRSPSGEPRTAGAPASAERGEHSYAAVSQFLAGSGVDHRGRTLSFILSQSDAWWEDAHDFVQWLFPSSQPSEYSVRAPVLTGAELVLLGQNLETRAGLRAAYGRMLTFLGLVVSADGLLSERPLSIQNPFPPAWMRRADHNDKRISRMLACLSGAGLHLESKALLDFLRVRFAAAPHKAESLSFWKEAARID